eukprot:CAMPEP_0173128194 /NCGR_PEP_ID=MMETSP1102-20130122/58321_1 /TAXON_ID=49646 /ORGANISM="Geminigera sp., Strain Caron Lab Isolate" /LENGTH=539 /DNA_ID=CAMNT_0014038115 /DNA_START=24 /DNA_END=1643 /DNA_ORIENTATION=-
MTLSFGAAAPTATTLRSVVVVGAAALVALGAAALGGLLVALAIVGRGGRESVMYQRWHTLKPDAVLRADEDFGPPIAKHAQARRSAVKPFFGLQHFDKSGHGMAAAGMRTSGLEAGTQMLHQQKKRKVNLPALWTATPTKTQALRGYTPQSSFIDITSPDTTDGDGYVVANAYRSELSANADRGQAAYVANWKARNLKGAKQMVKDAAKLYAKWDLVDPTTGRSSPNLVIPHDSSGYDEEARSTRMPFKNGPMLTSHAHLMMLKEVTADNGRTFVLPWWCVVVHPEANGDGMATGLSDADGRKYPEGTGWDGAKTPMGASGIPGVDCTHPGGSTLVPYDKDWPLWKGPRIENANAQPISDQEAAELEEGEEEAAEEEPAAEETAVDEDHEPADEEVEAEPESELGSEAESDESVEGHEDQGSEAAAEEEPSVARDVAGEQMLSSEFPSLTWRHGINTDNALNKPGKQTSQLNSDGPEYNVMEDDFVFPDYKSTTQMLAAPNDLESDDLGDEIFELPQDYGDVQVDPKDLEVQVFPGHYY